MRVPTDSVVAVPRNRLRFWFKLQGIVDLLFSAIYILLIVRGVLEGLDARKDAGFVIFMDRVTNPLYRPFQRILPAVWIDNVHFLAVSILVALVAYGLLHFFLRRILALAAQR